MEIRGKVNGGVVVLDDPKALPDGAIVRVEALEEAQAETEESTVWDALRKWGGRAKGLPSDFAEQHDHYLHGTPKR